MNDIPSVMTRKEAQEILKVSKNTILELLQNGYLLLLRADTGLQERH